LSKTRRKRTVPEDWATAETIESFKPLTTIAIKAKHTTFLSIDDDGEDALVGGDKGAIIELSIDEGKVLEESKIDGGNVTAGLLWREGSILGTSTGQVQVYQAGAQVAVLEAHSGAVTGLALHASGEILASIGADRSYILYDLETYKVLTQVVTDAGKSLLILFNVNFDFVA
jgi:pre-mRNA-processing factor 19